MLALRILGSVYQLLNDSQAENMLLMSYGTAKKLGSESLCLHVSKKLLGPSRAHRRALRRAQTSAHPCALSPRALMPPAAVRGADFFQRNRRDKEAAQYLLIVAQHSKNVQKPANINVASILAVPPPPQ